jgi:hypothetical protein
MFKPLSCLAACGALVSLSACSPIEDPGLYPAFDPATAAPIPDKRATEFSASRNLYWGDLHIHTSYSTDAWTMGVRTLPDDAYTFTRGGEIAHAGGYGVKLKRPLDFAAVTDHSEYLGVVRGIEPDLPLRDRTFMERMRNDGRLRNTIAFMRTTLGFDLRDANVEGARQYTLDAWADTIAMAQRHNQPGVFTAFVAYEWSSAPEKRNLHRNVIYRDARVPEVPYSSLNSEDPRNLWAELDRQRSEGMQVFAIPHNGNASDGTMYDAVMYDGQAMNADYAATRMRNEPISEIYQVKGASESHPQLSPDDPFAGFEIVDQMLSHDDQQSRPKGGYIRDALRTGIEMSHAEGFNPYRFGVIGASDGHNATAPVEEDNYHGKLPILDGTAATRLRLNSFLPREMPGGTIWGSGGLAAVWAEENTRGALFDAMVRKETYATSGPRIQLRFFGGRDYPADLLTQDNWVTVADELGVPMGGVLPAGEGAPSFAVWAMRDPDSGNLDRVQIIKGWVDDSGQSQEKIYDVAWSGERTPDADGVLPPVGNTVDVAAATYTNTIGAGQLSTLWTDPDYEPGVEAFYYARVIEIPTPRWSTYDAKLLGVEAPDPQWLQERAVTSAIWSPGTGPDSANGAR